MMFNLYVQESLNIHWQGWRKNDTPTPHTIACSATFGTQSRSSPVQTVFHYIPWHDIACYSMLFHAIPLYPMTLYRMLFHVIPRYSTISHDNISHAIPCDSRLFHYIPWHYIACYSIDAFCTYSMIFHNILYDIPWYSMICHDVQFVRTIVIKHSLTRLAQKRHTNSTHNCFLRHLRPPVQVQSSPDCIQLYSMTSCCMLFHVIPRYSTISHDNLSHAILCDSRLFHYIPWHYIACYSIDAFCTYSIIFHNILYDIQWYSMIFHDVQCVRTIVIKHSLTRLAQKRHTNSTHNCLLRHLRPPVQVQSSPDCIQLYPITSRCMLFHVIPRYSMISHDNISHAIPCDSRLFHYIPWHYIACYSIDAFCTYSIIFHNILYDIQWYSMIFHDVQFVRTIVIKHSLTRLAQKRHTNSTHNCLLRHLRPPVQVQSSPDCIQLYPMTSCCMLFHVIPRYSTISHDNISHDIQCDSRLFHYIHDIILHAIP